MAAKPAPTEKTCNKCGETKPVGEFGNDKYQPDGKKYRCKGCVTVFRPSQKLTEKQCGVCGIIKPIGGFVGRSRRCKVCACDRERKCTRCGVVKSAEQFAFRENRSSRASRCKCCQHQLWQAYANTAAGRAATHKRNHSEKSKARRRQYQKTECYKQAKNKWKNKPAVKMHSRQLDAERHRRKLANLRSLQLQLNLIALATFLETQ